MTNAGTDRAVSELHDPLDGYLTIVEAADVLGIHQMSLRRLIHQGKIDFALLIGGRYMLPRERLMQFAGSYTGRPGIKKGMRSSAVAASVGLEWDG